MFPALLYITTFPSSDYYISSYPICIDERNPCFRTIICHLLNLILLCTKITWNNKASKPYLKCALFFGKPGLDQLKKGCLQTLLWVCQLSISVWTDHTPHFKLFLFQHPNIWDFIYTHFKICKVAESLLVKIHTYLKRTQLKYISTYWVGPGYDFQKEICW